MGLTGGGI